MEQGVAQRVAYGAGAQGISFALSTLLQILMVPVFLSAWDHEVYADWLVLSAVVGLFSLADLGLQGYTTVAMRIAWARGDADGFHRALHVGLGAYAALMAVWTLVLLACALWVDLRGLLGLDHLQAVPETFVLLGLPMIALLPRGLVGSVYSARGALGREVMLAFVFASGALLAQMLAVLAGAAPPAVAAVQCAAGLLLGWGVLLPDLRRRHPDIVLRAALPTGAELRALLAKAPYYAVASGTAVLIQQIPVVVLGRLSAPAAVVAFTTARTFTGLTRQAARQLSDGVGIEMARQHARGDLGSLLRLYAGTARLAGGMVGLLAGLSMVLGPSFFALWTGGSLAFDAALAAGFFAPALLMAPAYGAGSLLRSTDLPDRVAAAFVMQAAGCLLLCPLLVFWLDALGAVIALGIAEALALGLYTMRVAARLLGGGLPGLALRTYGVALAALALGAGAAVLLDRLMPVRDVADLLLFGAAWCALLALPAFYLLFDAPHRAWLKEIASGRV